MGAAVGAITKALPNVLGGVAGRALTPMQPRLGQQPGQTQNVPNQQMPFNSIFGRAGQQMAALQPLFRQQPQQPIGMFGQIGRAVNSIMPQFGGMPNQPQNLPFGALGNAMRASNPLAQTALGLFNRFR